MAKYAAKPTVTADRSKQEIEATLERYGATEFMYGWREKEAVIGFKMQGKMVRFHLPLPDRNDTDIIRTPTGKSRTAKQAEEAYAQEV